MLDLLGKVPRLLPDWQLNRGLNEGSMMLARDAFSVDGTEGLGYVWPGRQGYLPCSSVLGPAYHRALPTTGK